MAAAAAASSAPRKLRVLCLHGFLQTESSYRGRAASFRRVLRRQAEFEYVQAPFRVVPPAHQGPPETAPPAYSWWKTSEDRRTYEGWREAVDAVAAAFERLGPFDGVLGFSQGAGMVAALAGLQRARDDPAAPGVPGYTLPAAVRFGFAVMIGGFVPRADDLAAVLPADDPLPLPTLHILGDADRMVTPDRSEALAARFRGSVTLRHPGGHYCPTQREFADQIAAFLEALPAAAAKEQ